MAPVYVRELLALPLFRDARVIAGHGGVARREISWPVVLEWPAEDFARPHELVLTTALSCDGPMLAQMVTEVSDAGAASMFISFSPGGDLHEVPDDVRELADERQFPLIELPWRLRFAEISKAVIDRVVERHLGNQSGRDALYLGFTRVVVDGRGFDGIAEALEDLLQRPVLIFDADFCLRGSGPRARRELGAERIVALAQTDGLAPGTVDALRRLMSSPKMRAISGIDGLGLEPGVGISAVVRHKIVGYVYALDVSGGKGLPSLEMRALEHAAVAVAMETARRRAAIEVETRLRGHFAWSIALGVGEPDEEVAGKATLLGYDLRNPYQLAIAMARDAQPDALNAIVTELQRWAKELRVEAMIAVRGPRVLLLLAGASTPTLRRLVEQAHAALTTQGVVATWGLGASECQLLELRRAYQEAIGAIAVARILNHGDGIADPAELGPLLMLLPLGRDAGARDMAKRVLAGIIDYDRTTSRDLLGTLRIYLEENGNTSAAARRLFLNRHSLLYRLKRIQELSGRSLESASDRFILDLSLKLLEFRDVDQDGEGVV